MNSIPIDSDIAHQMEQNRIYFSSPRIFDDINISIFEKSDICDEYLAWLNNPQHMQFSDQRFKVHSKESSLKFIESFEHSPNLFLKIANSTGLLVGTLTVYIDVHNHTHNCGILIGSNYSSAGYGKKAWVALTHEICANLGAHKIVAGTMETNLAMVKLFETSSMRLEARLRREKIHEGKEVDVLIYSRFIRNF